MSATDSEVQAAEADEAGMTDAGGPPQAGPPASRSGTLAVLLLGWIAAIMTTGTCLSAVALASATADLGLSSGMRSAAASAVSVAIAATAVAAGVAADRLGRRRILMWAYVLATAASLVCLIPSGMAYVAGNAVAGVAFGMILTATYAFVKAVVPPERLGKAIGLYGMFSIVFGTVMSVAGGLLADLDWRYLYLVVPAMCLPSFVLTPRLLPQVPRTGSGPVDLWGLVLLGAGLSALSIGLMEAGAASTRSVALALLAAAGALLAGWVVLELRRRAPSYPVRLFRSAPFVGAVLAGLLLNGVYAALVISLSGYLQYAKQDSVLAATFGLQPFYLIGAVAWAVAGHQLSAGRSARSVGALSSLIAAAGFLVLLPLQQDSPYWLILPGSLLIGYGANAALTAQAKVFMDWAPADAYGAVTSSRTTVGQLGYALGMIFTTVIITGLTASGTVRGLEAHGMSSTDAYTTLAALNSWLLSGQKPAIDDLNSVMTVVVAAFDKAFRVRMLLGAGIMTATAAAVWLLMKERRPR